MVGFLFLMSVANAGMRCVEVHKVFRVGVPADIVYALVIDSGSTVSEMTCLAEPMKDALEHYENDTQGAPLPSSIQSDLDALTKQPNELICGAFSCGDQIDIIANAQAMSRAYFHAAYWCLNSAECDEYDYAYLIDAEISHDGVQQTFGSTGTATCSEFTGAMIAGEWLSFTSCRQVGEESADEPPNCNDASTCEETYRSTCSEQKGYLLDRYKAPSGESTARCLAVNSCTPPGICTTNGVLVSDIPYITTP